MTHLLTLSMRKYFLNAGSSLHFRTVDGASMISNIGAGAPPPAAAAAGGAAASGVSNRLGLSPALCILNTTSFLGVPDCSMPKYLQQQQQRQ